MESIIKDIIVFFSFECKVEKIIGLEHLIPSKIRLILS